MFNKKMLWLVGLAVAVILITACGKEGSGGTTPPASTPPPTPNFEVVSPRELIERYYNFEDLEGKIFQITVPRIEKMGHDVVFKTSWRESVAMEVWFIFRGLEPRKISKAAEAKNKQITFRGSLHIYAGFLDEKNENFGLGFIFRDSILVKIED